MATICGLIGEFGEVNSAERKRLSPVDIPSDRRQTVRGVEIGLKVDAITEFFGERRGIVSKALESNPGFYLWDDKGRSYTCYMKYVDSTKAGDKHKLVITNVNGYLIMLEPRLVKGDEIYARVNNKSEKGGYYFHFLSYDCFIEGRYYFFNNRKINGLKGIQTGNYYKVKIFSTWISPNSDASKVLRVGFAKSIALEEVTSEIYQKNKNRIFRVE